jgi:diguanylate cyclase (GGDEF)-like protein
MTAPDPGPPESARRQRLPTLLIVDDTPANIQVLARALHRDYRIRIATDGAAALAMLNGPQRPDLVLLDVMMPELDGYEVCRRIKAEPATWDIPVIFVTARTDLADQLEGFRLGAVDYITKPFELPLVQARISVHIRLQQKAELLERLALLDGLTNLSNRRGLERIWQREWARAQRGGLPLSLLLIDVDHFKAYNDHYGHGAGDDCLLRVARELEWSLLRSTDAIGRYGGEEFVAILPDSDATAGLQVAERLRRRVAGLAIPHARSGTARQVTISIGCASCTPAPADQVVSLLEQADQALYQAKARGRNRVCLFGRD